MNDATQQPAPTDMRTTRKRWLAIVGGAFVAIAVAWGVYWLLALRYTQSTDDAYVSGNIVQITPQIAGTVVKIAADDTQFVNAGSTLVELDPADGKLALEAADAKLARTVRDVRGLFATTAQLRANLDMYGASYYSLQYQYDVAFAQCMYAQGNKVPSRFVRGSLDYSQQRYGPPNSPAPAAGYPAPNAPAPAGNYPPPSTRPDSIPPPNTPPPRG